MLYNCTLLSWIQIVQTRTSTRDAFSIGIRTYKIIQNHIGTMQDHQKTYVNIENLQDHAELYKTIQYHIYISIQDHKGSSKTNQTTYHCHKET